MFDRGAEDCRGSRTGGAADTAAGGLGQPEESHRGLSGRGSYQVSL